MEVNRREFLGAGVVAFCAIGNGAFAARGGEMFGLIGKMTAVPGKRDELVAILVEGTANMPGCLSYIVATDARDADTVWITEAWDGKDSHDASLALPAVKAAIAKGRPLIAAFGDRIATRPVGGHGLPAPERG